MSQSRGSDKSVSQSLVSMINHNHASLAQLTVMHCAVLGSAESRALGAIPDSAQYHKSMLELKQVRTSMMDVDICGSMLAGKCVH